MNQSWTIAILCFNEEASVQQVCEQALQVLNQVTNGDKEILILDDGSTDDSVRIIKELENRHEIVKGFYSSQNKGIGFVTKMAHQSASHENIYVISGDGEANVDELLKIKDEAISEDECFLFIRNKKPEYNWFRKLLTATNRFINNILFDIDIEDVNWNKVIKNKHAKLLNLQLSGVLVDSEIVLKLLKMKVKIIPVESKSNFRLGGEAKGASLKSVITSVKEINQLRKIMSQFKF